MNAEHSFNERDISGRPIVCRLCPGRDGRPGKCDHHRYTHHYLRFVKAHWQAFEAAYLDANSQAARNEQERLSREYRTLPPRHDCSCFGYHCRECQRLAQQRVKQDIPVEIGRTRPVVAPAPMTLLLDILAGYVV